METVRLLYKELFTIRFLHDGYGPERQTLISDSIRIKPDKETGVYLNNRNIGYRFYGNRLVCFIRSRQVAPPSREPQEPYIRDAEDITLRFLIYSSTGFISKTFAVNAGGKWVYQFSNKINNVEDAAPDDIFYLSQPVEPFSISRDYLEGTIVENVGDLYASIKTMNHADAIPITDEDHWQPFTPPAELVNNKDLVAADGTAPDEKFFGTIDIYYTGTADGYKLFDTAGQLLSPVYTLSFKNRE